MKFGAAFLMSLVTIDQAFAGYFNITPPPTPPVPEFDGSSGIAAIALLVSLTLIVVSRMKRQ